MSPQLQAETFKALFETAPDAMIVVDSGGRIVMANPKAERLFGYAAAGLEGLQIEALVPARARRVHEAHRAGYIEQPRARPMGQGQDLSGLRLDGTEFPAEIGLSPIESPDGRFYVAAIRDISETQRARQALVRARYDARVAQLSRLALESRGYEAMLESLPEIACRELDFDVVAVALAQARGDAMRIRAAHGLSGELEQVLEPVLRADFSAHLLRTSEAFVASSDELPDGKSESLRAGLAATGYGELVVVPLFGRERPFGALIAVARKSDVFDRDKVHFFRLVANVLAAAMQRTHAEEQLAHSQRLEAIGQLTGGIAHDFNNLLTVISGNLQLLESELEDKPEVQETLAAALRGIGRGAELTRKLLVFARRQRLHPQAIDPATLLGELAPMLARTLGESVKVEAACAPDTPHVFVDPAELDAALVNLAINARDAMPRGGTLYIGARAREVAFAESSSELAAGGYVAIEVRDSGTGMTPEVLARAFEPFFTTKEAGRGSGLGLSMVYGFVKQSGGHISVESRPGYGTRIELLLPAAAPAMKPKPVLKAAVGGNETILVVEDEAEVRRVAIAFLKSVGYATVAAANADEALQALRANEQVALLFSDVILGSGMNGRELAQAARRLRANLPVLLTSGYERVGHAEDDAPMELPLLRKPYRREELIAAVRTALARTG